MNPFSKKGLKWFLFSLLFEFIPGLQFVSKGIMLELFSKDGEYGKGMFLRSVKTGFRAGIAVILAAGPSLFVFGLFKLLGSIWEEMPDFVAYGFLGVLALLTAVLLVVTPAIECSIGLGAPIGRTLSIGEMLSVIGGCPLRFISSFLLTVPFFLLFWLFKSLPDIALWMLSAAFGSVYNSFSTGLYMAATRKSLGIRPFPDMGKGFPMQGARAAALVLALVCVFEVFPVDALAARPIGDLDIQMIPNPADGASGNGQYDPAAGVDLTDIDKAVDYYRKQGLFDGGNYLIKDQNTGKFYMAAESEALINKKREAVKELAILAADVATDNIPGIGNIKSGLQVLYYGVKAISVKDKDEKALAWKQCGYKVVGLSLGPLGKLSKFANNPQLKKYTIDALQKGMEYNDKLGNLSDFNDNMNPFSSLMSSSVSVSSEEEKKQTITYIDSNEYDFKIADAAGEYKYDYNGKGTVYVTVSNGQLEEIDVCGRKIIEELLSEGHSLEIKVGSVEPDHLYVRINTVDDGRTDFFANFAFNKQGNHIWFYECYSDMNNHLAGSRRID